MAVSVPRPQSTVQSRWPNRLVWSLIVVCSLLFAGLTIYRIRSRDLDEANADRLHELSTAAPTATAAQGPTGLDWPQWRGPNRDGVSTETGLLETWPEAGPKVLWRQPT